MRDTELPCRVLRSDDERAKEVQVSDLNNLVHFPMSQDEIT